MKITCNIIKDLLPLYVEDMLSDDSVVMVEDHIKKCPACKSILAEMKEPYQVPVDMDTAPLLSIKSKLKKKKLQLVTLSIIFLIIILTVTLAFLTAPAYIPYSQKIVRISELGDGALVLEFDDRISGYDIESHLAEDKTGYVYHISTWDSLWNRKIVKFSPKNLVLNPKGENVVSIYYIQADGSDDILLYGKDLNPSGGIITLPRLVLSYYVLLALLVFAITSLMALIFRQNKKVFNIFINISMFSLSYLLGHLAIKGFDPTSYYASKDFALIGLITILLYIALLILRKLIRELRD